MEKSIQEVAARQHIANGKISKEDMKKFLIRDLEWLSNTLYLIRSTPGILDAMVDRVTDIHEQNLQEKTEGGANG